MNQLDSNNPDQIKQMFDFWNDTPITKRIDKNMLLDIFNSPVRGFILEILSNGIYDNYPETKFRFKRRALSALEISKQLEEQYQTKVKKANLYWHLQKLEDTGFIKTVLTLRKGKRFTTYFGKTAKIYLTLGDEVTSFHTILFDSNFIQLVKNLNDGQLPTSFSQVIDNLKPISTFKVQLFESWATRYQHHFNKLDLDLFELSNLYNIIYRFTPNVGLALKKLGELLKFNSDIDTTKQFEEAKPNPNEIILLTKKDLINFWDTVPIIKILPNPAYEKIDYEKLQDKGTAIRQSIVKILQIGISYDGYQRHALTAKEISDQINSPINREIKQLEESLSLIPEDRKLERNNIEMQILFLKEELLKKSNLYFHLSKLEESGLIRDIGFTKQGKRHTTYYGVCAKIFAPISPDDMPTFKLFYNIDFFTFINNINPDKKEGDMLLLIRDLKKLNITRYDIFQSWVESHARELEGLEIDYTELAEIIFLMIRFTPPVIKALDELAELLKIR